MIDSKLEFYFLRDNRIFGLYSTNIKGMELTKRELNETDYSVYEIQDGDINLGSNLREIKLKYPEFFI